MTQSSSRRASDCGKCVRSIFHQVLTAQMPPTFSMGVDKWECANVPIDCRIYFRGRMKASRITTAKPWRRQSNCYSNKPTLRRINRQAGPEVLLPSVRRTEVPDGRPEKVIKESRLRAPFAPSVFGSRRFVVAKPWNYTGICLARNSLAQKADQRDLPYAALTALT